jgi:hypothetical protein
LYLERKIEREKLVKKKRVFFSFVVGSLSHVRLGEVLEEGCAGAGELVSQDGRAVAGPLGIQHCRPRAKRQTRREMCE